MNILRTVPSPRSSSSTAGSPSSGPAGRPARGDLRTRLAEMVAYAGAGLVVAAAALIVSQTWDDLSQAGRIALLAGIAVLLLCVGLAAGGLIGRSVPARRAVLQTEPAAVRRRLASTLLVGGAASAAGAVGVWVDAGGDLGVDRGWPPTAATGLLLALPAWWLTGTVLAELAVAAAGLMTFVSLGAYVPIADPWGQFSIFVLGLAWTAAALGGLARHRMVSASTGLLVAYGAAMSAGVQRADGSWADWPAYVLLGVLAALCFADYVRSQQWPSVAVGLLSLMSLVLRGVGEMAEGVLGRALGILAAGTVLLVGAWLVWRRRRPVPAGPGYAAAGWVLPEGAYRSAFADDPLPHAIIDASGTVVDGNTAMAQALHLAPQSLRGQPLDALLAGQVLATTRTRLAEGHTLVTLDGAGAAESP